MSNMIRRVRRGTRWFLRNRRSGLVPSEEVLNFKTGVVKVQKHAHKVVDGAAQKEWQERNAMFKEKGVSDEWVEPLSMPANLFSGLSVVEVANITKCDVVKASEVFFYLQEKLGLNLFANQVSNVRVETYWQAMARESFIDDLEAQLRKITAAFIGLMGDNPIDEVFAEWELEHGHLTNRWRSMINEVESTQVTDYAMFSVAMRELIDVAQAAEFSRIVSHNS